MSLVKESFSNSKTGSFKHTNRNNTLSLGREVSVTPEVPFSILEVLEKESFSNSKKFHLAKLSELRVKF